MPPNLFQAFFGVFDRQAVSQTDPTVQARQWPDEASELSGAPEGTPQDGRSLSAPQPGVMAVELATLQVQIQTLQSRYDRESGALEQLQQRLAAAEARLNEIRERLQILEAVQILFAKTSELARVRVKAHVEQVVTAALQAVFGRDMQFEIVLTDQAGQTAASWRVVDTMEGGQTVSGNPEDARGGGVSDVVSLALRLALLELVRPKPGGPILLDEPGKHVSAEHRQALGEFLKAYARRTGRQIIMVTHHEELAAVADVAYRIERRNGVSEVTRL